MDKLVRILTFVIIASAIVLRTTAFILSILNDRQFHTFLDGASSVFRSRAFFNTVSRSAIDDLLTALVVIDETEDFSFSKFTAVGEGRSGARDGAAVFREVGVTDADFAFVFGFHVLPRVSTGTDNT